MSMRFPSETLAGIWQPGFFAFWNKCLETRFIAYEWQQKIRTKLHKKSGNLYGIWLILPVYLQWQHQMTYPSTYLIMLTGPIEQQWQIHLLQYSFNAQIYCKVITLIKSTCGKKPRIGYTHTDNMNVNKTYILRMSTNHVSSCRDVTLTLHMGLDDDNTFVPWR